MIDFASLWATIVAVGPWAVLGALVIVAIVYVLAYTDLLKNGDMKRLAVVVLTFLLNGVDPGNQESAVRGALILIVSTLLKLVIDGIKMAVAARKK